MKQFYFIVAFPLFASVAWGQGSWTVSGGYSDLHFLHATSGFNYNHDGVYLDGDANVLLPGKVRVLAGVGFSGSWHYEDNYNYGSTVVTGNASNVGLFNVEGRLGLPLSSRATGGFFLLPRIGAGLLIDDYWIDTPFYTAYHTGAAFELRPCIQAGYSWGPGSVGAELSYMWAWGDFGSLGSNAQELRAGVFLRFRF
ncbi:MAG TPA: hypothetical protein VK797_07505 [Tepidisphaeraceae bacterium]|jgi:hypothetical protein|nr:hypothetical protein [Tepidisphaeraceae bacterium]